MRNIDELAIAAASDDFAFASFVASQKHFITNCAYKTSHKYITDKEDEWSIALIAFSNAVKTYDYSKGSFLPYANTLISHSLIDYYRSLKKYTPELLVDPMDFEANSKTDESTISLQLEINKISIKETNSSIKDEINEANQVFLSFGFSFYSLADSSPKSIKTRAGCKIAVNFVLDHPILINEIRHKKQLPIKIIQKNTNLPRKLLEFHRRYIIAAIEILSGEYPYLAEYMSYIRKEGK